MSEHLDKYIKELISSNGMITFAEFVDIALYHNEFGYYNSTKPRIGVEGDFYTSPDVHQFVGRVLAKTLNDLWQMLDNENFVIVEIGAGKGTMALDILDEIKCKYPAFFNKITYVIIEKSKTLKITQMKLLDFYKEKVDWIDSLAVLESRGKIDGCVISNELIDAFPFHRVCMVNNKFKEIYVDVDNDDFVEKIGEPSNNQLLEYLNRLNIKIEEGMKTEINLEAMRWINGISRILNRGFVLTIDYGHPAYSYYAPSRYKGTFLCYYKHTTNENIFENIGEQDITTHVDFTSLAVEGEKCGLELLTFTELWSFLMQCGQKLLEEEMERLQNGDQKQMFKTTSAIKNLVHPEGMGGKFKVLIQTKGVKAKDIVGNHFNKKHLLGVGVF